MLSILKISHRIWILAIVSIVIFAATYLFETFQKRDDLLASKQDKLIAVVETAHGLVAASHARFKAGDISEQEAKEAAAAAVRTLRYQGGEYFWINDMTPVMVMHPIKPALEGKNLSQTKDPEGKFLFVEFVKKVRNDGAGFVDYFWPKPGKEAPVPKLSYVKGFPEWQWIVGSGVYIDDIDDEFSNELRNNLTFLAFVLVFLFALSFIIVRSILKPLVSTVTAMQEISHGEGDLRVRLASKGHDEMAQLAGGFNGFVEKVQAVVQRVTGYGERLMAASNTMANITERSNQLLSQHQEETHQVATAVHQMSATVQEVARNASDAARSIQEVRTEALDGQAIVEQSIESIRTLATSVDQAAEAVQALENETQNIGSILDVIRSIADQTNLLALNAAIEAARAGEQGRGFAVVADEVRTLAQRTQESTEEIQRMIEQLQRGANSAVQVIRSGRDEAEVSVSKSRLAGESLASITTNVLQVADVATQIASATEEQSSTVDMINQNVSNINQAFIETSAGAEEMAGAARDLNSLADELNQTLSSFKV